MNKKNNQPFKPLLWILVVLLAIVYLMPRIPRNIALTVGSLHLSQKNFTLSTLFANMQNQNTPSGKKLNTNDMAQQNNPPSGQTENVNAANGHTPNAIPAENTPASEKTNATQAENNAGNNTAAGNQTNTPTTANPIPTDADALQRVARQDQRLAEAYAVLAAHQALAAQVMQAAANSKNQTVTAQKIPAPYTGQAPDDVMEKLKSNQIVASH